MPIAKDRYWHSPYAKNDKELWYSHQKTRVLFLRTQVDELGIGIIEFAIALAGQEHSDVAIVLSLEIFRVSLPGGFGAGMEIFFLAGHVVSEDAESVSVFVFDIEREPVDVAGYGVELLVKTDLFVGLAGELNNVLAVFFDNGAAFGLFPVLEALAEVGVGEEIRTGDGFLDLGFDLFNFFLDLFFEFFRGFLDLGFEFFSLGLGFLLEVLHGLFDLGLLFGHDFWLFLGSLGLLLAGDNGDYG